MLGVRVDCVDMEGTLERIEGWVAERSACRQVATVNPEFVMRAGRDPEFAAALEQADLCLADGAGVLWAVRRQGCRLRERVTGSDLVPELARRAARRGHRLFLLGAGPGVAEEAARRLVAANPGLQVVGTHAGEPGPEADAETRRLLEAAAPDILLVAYGAPKQELWIQRNRPHLSVPVALGVGGTFDFIAGRARRAPLWMRRIHLEWLHRLWSEPWRARRMAVLPVYAARVLIEGR